jgi:SAM-dependent methyltransferase
MNTSVLTRPDAVADPVKAKHEAVWASGDYTAVATEVIPTLGPVLVDAVRVAPGDRVLDVAAGAGNAAIPAAQRGATVVASDLTPALLERGRTDAAEHGVTTIAWEQGDAEALPYDDASFDVVMSCVGVMFAPHHQVAADELVRVLRPGGRLGLLSWTPSGFIGQMFATMKPFVPAPPPGAQPPPLWGDAAHVQDLLGDRVADVDAQARKLRTDRFGTAEEFVAFFKAFYGPTIAAFKNLADQPDRAAELEAALVDVARRHDLGGGVMEWEYLLLTATRA